MPEARFHHRKVEKKLTPGHSFRFIERDGG
jgi:hypothetical protein